jgi:hypothetical protein
VKPITPEKSWAQYQIGVEIATGHKIEQRDLMHVWRLWREGVAPKEAKLMDTYPTTTSTRVVDGLKIVYIVEHRVGGWIHFTAPASFPEEWAKSYQQRLGYHPAGYGFFGYKTDAEKRTTTWRCASNSD